MKTTILLPVISLFLFLASCTNPNDKKVNDQTSESSNYQNLLINGFITRKIKSKVSNTLFYNCLFFSDTYDNNYR